ncbi:hypothetical protein [Cohnella yongneupensis]|uniref:Uncharacterized protein n=1 Tax=Cohnella yongneupensis TaxID=425006 RepID=A0ABW0QYM8_9BACL
MPNIKFRELDYRQDFETDILEIADHFKVKRKYFFAFTALIHESSRWNSGNLEQGLNRWEIRFLRAGGIEKVVVMVREAFNKCTTTDKIKKLRGAIVEAILIASHGGSGRLNDPTNYGWGASVFIGSSPDAHQVGYECDDQCGSFTGDTCGTRYTVDVGDWNGYHAKLYECKAHPDSIKCKDVEFLRKLSNELQSHRVSHEIFFVSIVDKEEIEIKLREYNAPSFFKSCGRRELEAMIPA